MEQTKATAVFTGHTYAHEWKEGAFAGAAYDMAYLPDNTVRWTATAGQPKGNSAVEKYQHVQLSPTLHQFSWKEASTGYFVVLTYDLENQVVHGLINVGDQAYVLKGPFSRTGPAK